MGLGPPFTTLCYRLSVAGNEQKKEGEQEKQQRRTCCTHLAILLQSVATCCELKIELMRMPRCNTVARTWPNDYNAMQHPQMLHEKFDQFQI